MRMLLVSLALVSLAAPSWSAEAEILSAFGLGPVRIGMSVPEAEKALGAALEVETIQDGDACGYARRKDERDANIAYMVEDGRITRIDVSRPRQAGAHQRPVVTEAGVGLQSTEEEVRKAYGPRLKAQPNKYDDRERDLTVDEPDRKRAIVFETLNGGIGAFRAGVYPSVGYIEGCL